MVPFSFTVGVESMPPLMTCWLNGTACGANVWAETQCVNDALVSPILRPIARSRLTGNPFWARS